MLRLFDTQVVVDGRVEESKECCVVAEPEEPSGTL